jgi:hypothetical protein
VYKRKSHKQERKGKMSYKWPMNNMQAELPLHAREGEWRKRRRQEKERYITHGSSSVTIFFIIRRTLRSNPSLSVQIDFGRNIEAEIRYPDPVPRFFRFQREPIETKHNWPLDMGIIFLLPNPTIF